MTHKRGITPLIASILLIGIVIVVVAIIVLWGGKITEDLKSKEGSTAELQLNCASVRFNVLSTDNGLVKIENTGPPLEGVVIVAKKGTTANNAFYDDPIEEGATRSYAYTGIPGVTNPSKLTIIPTIGKGIYRPCTDQKMDVKL